MPADAWQIVTELAKRSEDPYAGGRLDDVRRFGGLLWGVSLLFTLLLSAFYPPTHAFGDAGWAVAIGCFGGCAVACGLLVAAPERLTWDRLLLSGYLGSSSLALMQWLAGGWRAPYHELLALVVLGNALVHPPRRFLPLLAFSWAAGLAPLAYPGDHGLLGATIVALVLWTGLAAFCLVLMARLRRQRAGLALASETAEREARLDPLTRLENRRAFDEDGPAALQRGRAGGAPLTLAIGDLDGVKAINDRHGHLAGNACLLAVAATLRSHARDGDRVFRWAGDELALLLDGTDERTTAQVCSRLEEAVARAVQAPERTIVRLTLGWARDTGEGTLDDLVAAADNAMLARKARRRLAATDV